MLFLSTLHYTLWWSHSSHTGKISLLFSFFAKKIPQSCSCYFDVSFNAIKAIGCNLDGSYFKECLAEYDINETVYPIGEACRKNLLVLMTLTESFYCFTDGLLLFLGGSVDEMLDCIVGECRKPIEIE